MSRKGLWGGPPSRCLRIDVAPQLVPRSGTRLGAATHDAAHRLPQSPNVWSDETLVLDEVLGAASPGSGVCAHLSGAAWFHRKWGDLDLLHPVPGFGAESCLGFCSVLGSLQTAQRAELWVF